MADVSAFSVGYTIDGFIHLRVQSGSSNAWITLHPQVARELLIAGLMLCDKMLAITSPPDGADNSAPPAAAGGRRMLSDEDIKRLAAALADELQRRSIRGSLHRVQPDASITARAHHRPPRHRARSESA